MQFLLQADEDIISDVFGISMFNADILEYRGTINLMKGAMEAANYVTTVSPSYAEEIFNTINQLKASKITADFRRI